MSDWTPRQYRLSRWVVGLFVLLCLCMVAFAQPDGEHQHPSRDALIHSRFYNTWDRPDYPGNNCCKNQDCYPTKFKRVGADWFVLTRRIIKDADDIKVIGYEYNDPEAPASWILVPPDRLENNLIPGRKATSSVTGAEYVMREPRDSPDDRSHACILETTPGTYYVLCAVLGLGG